MMDRTGETAFYGLHFFHRVVPKARSTFSLALAEQTKPLLTAISTNYNSLRSLSFTPTCYDHRGGFHACIGIMQWSRGGEGI